MSDERRESTPGREDAERGRERWTDERTTFQRVYDVMTGVTEFESASAIADRAACSDDGARNALAQLVEMGVVDERDGRPVTYRRNDSYFEWKRIEALASEYSTRDLRDRIDELLAEDETFRERFDAPDPDAIAPATVATADHDELHDHWDAVTRWRSVRHDIAVLQRAAHRADERSGGRDTVSA